MSKKGHHSKGEDIYNITRISKELLLIDEIHK